MKTKNAKSQFQILTITLVIALQLHAIPAYAGEVNGQIVKDVGTVTKNGNVFTNWFKRFLPQSDAEKAAQAARSAEALANSQKKAAEALARQTQEADNLVTGGGTKALDVISDRTGELMTNVEHQVVHARNYVNTVGIDAQMAQVVSGVTSHRDMITIIEGPIGSGKSQFILGLMERILALREKLKRVPNPRFAHLHNSSLPVGLHDATIIRLNTNKLAKEDEAQDAINQVYKLLEDTDETVIVHVDSIEKFTSGKENEAGINLLISVMERFKTKFSGRVKFVLEATPEQAAQLREANTMFRTAYPVKIGEATIEQSVSVLREALKVMNNGRPVYPDEGVLHLCATWAKRYFPEIGLPNSALLLYSRAFSLRTAHNTMKTWPSLQKLKDQLKVIDENLDAVSKLKGAHARARRAELPVERESVLKLIAEEEQRFEAITKLLERNQQLLDQVQNLRPGEAVPENIAKELSEIDKQINRVTEEDIAMAVHDLKDIPIDVVLARPGALTRNAVREYLSGVIKGQPRVVEAATDFVMAFLSPMKDRSRGLSFLAIGLSGVGKTELFHAIVRLVTPGKKGIRIDFSEYTTEHTISKLIGAPPGYHGTEKGVLTNAVKQDPRSVLNGDEIDKTIAEILNLQLQIIDSGRLSNGAGDLIDFTNVMSIWTMNQGASELLRLAKELKRWPTREEIVQFLHALDPNKYKLEILNRHDYIVLFDALKYKHLGEIMDKFINQMNEILDTEFFMNVELTDTAMSYIRTKLRGTAKSGRDVRRVVTERIRNKIFHITTSEGRYLDDYGNARQVMDAAGNEVYAIGRGDKLIADYKKGEGLVFRFVP